MKTINPTIELMYCKNCMQMTNHQISEDKINIVCCKCKKNRGEFMNEDEFRKYFNETIENLNKMIKDCCIPRLDANAKIYLKNRMKRLIEQHESYEFDRCS